MIKPLLFKKIFWNTKVFPFSSNISNSQTYPNMLENPQLTFSALGLDEKKIENIYKNPQLSSTIQNLFQRTDMKKCNKKQANLIYNFATRMTPLIESKSDQLINYILDEKVNNVTHLEQIICYMKTEICKKGNIDWSELEKNLGLSTAFTSEQIEQVIDECLKNLKNCQNKELCGILRKLRAQMPGVDGQVIFERFNKKIETLKNNKEFEESKTKANDEKEKEIHIWDKLNSLNARELLFAVNTEENHKKHMEITKGKIFLRFPPEPNGFLHIGHAKAMRTNFHSADVLNGSCNLRYDDTNPEKESEEFIKSIQENIKWLGYNPTQITHASDYFSKIYDAAIHLIKTGKAYVCEQTQDEIKSSRKSKMPSPHRNRSIEENLKLFDKMKKGEFKENTACLRLKIDHEDVNPTMRDPVAFRVKFHSHPKTKREWNIYPTYDFTHCISDSIEHISHSLCTLEFEIRRDLYYWILDALEFYKPLVWEYSRLNISRTILSKRKLKILVEEKLVEGWNDPRLLTLNGLRRRGYTPNAINEFCDLVNVTRRGNENIIPIQLLEHCLRKELNRTAERTMAIIDPIEVLIENLDSSFMKEIEVSLFPNDPNSQKRKIIVTNHLYIDRNDIKNYDCKNFYGLSNEKVVCLKYFGYVSCSKIITDENGDIKKVFVKFLEEINGNIKKNCKGILHWLSVKEAVDCEVRIFDYLFNVDDPNSLEDFKSEINKNSLKFLKNAKISKKLAVDIGEGFRKNRHYQFERVGYFIEDLDSEKNKIVFNMSVGLNEKEKSKINE